MIASALLRPGLRLRLALAIALVSALVAAAIGVVVYRQSRTDRVERAREAVAADVRVYARVIDGVGITPDGASVETETARDALAGLVPDALRERVRAGGVASIVADLGGERYVVAGARLDSGGRVYALRSLAADEQALADLRRTLLAAGLGAGAAGAALGLVIAALLARPLRRSAAMARRIAAGELTARLAPSGHDEIAALGRSLDEMAAALERTIGELDEAASRERRFAADVTHELRTPVTGLVAAAALLDDSPGARMVRERAARLAGLVEDLLEVMRLEAGAETARLERFDLVRLVRDVVRERDVEASIVGAETLEIVSDARRLERIVGNLLDNAVRHGRPPLEVTVDAPGTVVVRDGGSGFGAFLGHAGERFALAARARGGGSGLGLAIARGQARVLGASLALSDDGGAVATLRLPPLPNRDPPETVA